MAQTQPAQSLDTLKNVIDRVLIETGKAVRRSANPDSRDNSIVVDRMKKELPVWTSNYHKAIDWLEDEIIKAQSILRRDLSVRRKERIQREEAAVAARRNLKRKEAPLPANTTLNNGHDNTNTNDGPPNPENLNKSAKIEATIEKNEGSLNVEPTKPAASLETNGLSLPTGKPVDPSNQQSTDQAAANSSENDTQPITSADPFLEPAPASAGLKDFDFESMFPDSVGDGNEINPESNDGNDFDFSMALSDSNNLDNTLSNDVGQTSMDSLLPGLESYANSLGDLAGTGDLDGSDLSMRGGAETQADAVPNSATAGGDSTFDDLFSYADFEMGQGDGQGDGNNGMTGTEFDDLFLDPDES